MTKAISAAQAAALIKDGDTVAFSGFGLACVNQEVIAALEERWLAGQGPRGLTIVNSSAVGARGKREGLGKLSYEGLVKRWIGGIMSASPALGQLAADNKLECYNLPQGVMTALYREIAAHRPGVTDVLERCTGMKIVVVNLDAEPGETAGFTAERYLHILQQHAASFTADVVIVDEHSVPNEADRTYLARAAANIGAKLAFHDVREEDSSGYYKSRHDPKKLAAALGAEYLAARGQ